MRAILQRPSANYDARPAGKAIDLLLLHYTGMRDGAAALQRLSDPTAKVSSHYLIGEDGTVYRLVEESRRAWRAGQSYWAGERDINGISIGIELVNPGHEFGYRAFPQAQMSALIELARDILARNPIPPWRVLGHSDVAPNRRSDPGELFDWRSLAAAGIGFWPEPAEGPADLASLQRALAKYGYELAPTGECDDQTRACLRAFQRHFRPERIDGLADAQCRALIHGLARAVDARRTSA
jgi:N-acetylmuramoyl-L-alanine amidase